MIQKLIFSFFSYPAIHNQPHNWRRNHFKSHNENDFDTSTAQAEPYDKLHASARCFKWLHSATRETNHPILRSIFYFQCEFLSKQKR